MISRLLLDTRPRSHAEMERAWRRTLWWHRYGPALGLVVALLSGVLGWWTILRLIGR